MICPAPENCEKARPWVPTTALPLLVVQTKPLSAFTVPFSTNTNAPAASTPLAKSSTLVGSPDAFTL